MNELLFFVNIFIVHLYRVNLLILLLLVEFCTLILFKTIYISVHCFFIFFINKKEPVQPDPYPTAQAQIHSLFYAYNAKKYHFPTPSAKSF